MAIPYRSSGHKWSKSELDDLVTQGVLIQSTDVIEHVAIDPFWLSDPLQGISEDFDSAISTWRPRWVHHWPSNTYIGMHMRAKCHSSGVRVW